NSAHLVVMAEGVPQQVRVDVLQPGAGPDPPDEPVQAADGQPPPGAQPQVRQVRAVPLAAPAQVPAQRLGGRDADDHAPDFADFAALSAYADPPGLQVIQADAGQPQAGQLGDPQAAVQSDADHRQLARVLAGLQQPPDLFRVQVRDPVGDLRAAHGDRLGDVPD